MVGGRSCGEASGRGSIAGFGFDHRCDGMIVGCRRDNKELFAIQVEDNVVTRQVLRPRDERYVDWPPLPYEERVDRERAWLTSARGPQPTGGTVWSVLDPR